MEGKKINKPETEKVNATEHSEIDNDKSSEKFEIEIISEGIIYKEVMILD